jgi:phage-related protein
MSDFPTLSRPPEWEIKEDVLDSTIKSDFESGYVQTRPRFTSDRKKWSNVVYKNLNTSDVALLRAFITAVRGGSESFNWTNPDDSTTYIVRFDPVPTITYMATAHYYQAEMGFMQV